MTSNKDMQYVLSHPDWYTIDTEIQLYVAVNTAPTDYKEAVKRFNDYKKEKDKRMN